MGNVRTQLAFDGGDEMEHLLETFQLQEVRDPHTAEFADLSQIVAQEVGDHEQFGALFFAADQIDRRALVGFRLVEAGPGAFDRTGADVPPAHFEKRFRRGGNDLAAAKVEECGVGRGAGRAEAQGERQGVRPLRPWGAEPVGEVDLIDIPGGDVILGPAHEGLIVLRGGVGLEPGTNGGP